MFDERIFKRVLLAVDGSLPSITAEELTVFMAKKLDSHVTVLNVISHEFMDSRLGSYIPILYKDTPLGTGGRPEERVSELPASGTGEALSKEITASYLGRSTEIVEEAAALFEEQGIRVDRKILEHADPAEIITREAEKGNHDLIVVGYSGQDDKEPHLGSIAKKTALYAKTSVLVAREKSQISKMMVPVDGSEHSKKVVRYAAVLASKLGANVLLLNVQEPDLPPKIMKEMGIRILSEAVGQFRGTKLDQKLVSGDPAKTIIQTAREEDCDLILLGHKGHSAVIRFLLGSVSDHVVQYADRSVLLIR
ncbi:MAG: universal stress protein [Candidatus Bathyarchaeia archaeon]|jgi:nucleotide-binding universal stress UspA family protein